MGKEKQTPIMIDDKEFIYEEMTQEQQLLVNHISDLSRKIDSAAFNLDQLQVGKEAFVARLKSSLENSEEN